MLVTLSDLDLSNPQPLRGGAAIGYPCRFESELGGGPALLAARPDGMERTPGSRLKARLLPEAANTLRPLPASEKAGPSLRPLPSAGDFEAVGKVASILWLDDEQENGVLEILLGEELLSVPLESDGTDLTYGEWVVFQMQRLVLLEE
jgi:hypothetical protein